MISILEIQAGAILHDSLPADVLRRLVPGAQPDMAEGEPAMTANHSGLESHILISAPDIELTVRPQYLHSLHVESPRRLRA
jgi:hypothetical protein